MVRAGRESGADLIHLDVMDNHYVRTSPSARWCARAAPARGAAARYVHLMVKPVDGLVPGVRQGGASIISFHPEASEHVDRTIALIREHGCKAGLVLNPATPLSCLDHTSRGSTWC